LVIVVRKPVIANNCVAIYVKKDKTILKVELILKPTKLDLPEGVDYIILIELLREGGK